MLTRMVSVPGSPDRPNEDVAVAAEDCVVLLDGATVRTSTGCRHGVAWYVDQLAAAILVNAQLGPVGALARAIAHVADQHRDTCDLAHPGTPSAAVAILQVAAGEVCYLVLGDTTVVLQRAGGLAVVTDDRVNQTALTERAAADRFPIGTPEKAQALVAMKHAELAVRNRAGGFWVATGDPSVVEHALVGRVPVSELQRAVLLSDGAARAVTPFGLVGWDGLVELVASDGPRELVDRVRAAEAADPGGERWPRNKMSDDATVIDLEVSANIL